MDTITGSKKGKIMTWIIVVIVILGLGLLANNYKKEIKKFFGFAAVISSLDNAITRGWTTSGYAWGENTGWVNVGTTTIADVYVTDTELYGYAYGENVGWISLNCANSGNSCTNSYKISNNGDGYLSGYAYGENTGWIDFGTSTNITSRSWGVRIATTTGVFSGYAYGENIGWINFTNGTVATEWVPAVARTCTGPDGSILANESTTTYYYTNWVKAPLDCDSNGNSEARHCTDYSLSGTFTYPTCIVGPKGSGARPIPTVNTDTVSTTSNSISTTTSTSTIIVATTTNEQGGSKDDTITDNGSNPTTTGGNSTPDAGGTSTIISGAFTEDLYLDMENASVMALQNFLIGQGYSISAGATGYFGIQTKTALAKFQADNDISPAVGYFGPITRAKVNSMLGL